ncbi:hypothetical protein Tco_1506012 [Tanacetum coccineum]
MVGISSREVHLFRGWGLDLMGFIHRKMGQRGRHSVMGRDKWRDVQHFPIRAFQNVCLRRSQKNISVALKLYHDELLCSFRRAQELKMKRASIIPARELWRELLLFRFVRGASVANIDAYKDAPPPGRSWVRSTLGVGSAYAVARGEQERCFPWPQEA